MSETVLNWIVLDLIFKYIISWFKYDVYSGGQKGRRRRVSAHRSIVFMLLISTIIVTEIIWHPKILFKMLEWLCIRVPVNINASP